VTQQFALPQVGDLLADKYRVLRVVADGGMGVVFEAHHELLGKNVALKFPLPELAHLPSIVERFLAEARLCARIENEHVVRVLDVSKLDGLPYIVMELVTGVSLASEMGQPWPPAKAAAYAVQVLEGLEAVHTLGIVHRDVKPENVLVVATPRGPILKLIDFGIAKDSITREAIKRLTHAGLMLGTPAYMAPEQIVDPVHAGSSADLYSVGILLFEMLAGSSPFTGETVEQLAEQALSGRLRSLTEIAPSVPPALAEIVTRATALSVVERFASASDFKRALLPLVAGPSLAASATVLDTSDITQAKTVLRTIAPEPAVVPATVPAPPLLQTREENHVRVLALGVLGFLAVLAVAATGFVAVRRHRAEENSSSSSPPLAPFVPETDIAPLDSESAAASASAGAAPPPVKRAESRAAAVPKEASAETLGVVQEHGRRLRACNIEPQASEVTVELHIASDGSVQNARAVNSTASAPVTECVLSECRSLQFPSHEGPEQVVLVPIQLPAASDEPEPRERRHRPDWMPGRSRRRWETE
jgi:serine/threonine protein kinase